MNRSLHQPYRLRVDGYHVICRPIFISSDPPFSRNLSWSDGSYQRGSFRPVGRSVSHELIKLIIGIRLCVPTVFCVQ